MRKIRAFIGVRVPRELSKKLRNFMKEEISGKFRRVKEVEEENIHITLKFLGEIDERDVDVIIQRLSEVRFRRFDVSVKGVGFFPAPPYSPRVVWVGGESKDILKLKREIDSALEKVGFQPDKNFVSHITLGRIKSRELPSEVEKIQKSHRYRDFGKFEVREFTLFESKLTPKGPIYTEIKKFELE